MKNQVDLFDYNDQPGRKRLITDCPKFDKPLISIITPYYNAKKYFQQTFNSIINQTFPFWEWIIVNDGSTEPNTIEFVENLCKNDIRIKLINTENMGPSKARMLGVEHAQADFIFFIDADDLINKTVLECSYWCLKTNKSATWAYANTVGFGMQQYLWDVPFDWKLEKVENVLCVTSMIRKEAFVKAGGYDTTSKYFHEDWQLWLKLLSLNYAPAQMNFFGFWYRRRESRMFLINNDITKKKTSDSIIKKYARRVRKNVDGLIFPYVKGKSFELKFFDWKMPKFNNISKKEKVLLLGNNVDLDVLGNPFFKGKDIVLIMTNCNDHVLRQKLETKATVFDLSSFLTIDNWFTFIDYLTICHTILNVVFIDDNYFSKIMPFLLTKHNEIEFNEYANGTIFNKKIEKFETEKAMNEYHKYLKENSDIFVNKSTSGKKFVYRFGRKMWKYKSYRALIGVVKKIKECLGYENKG